MKRLVSLLLECADEACHRHGYGPPGWLCTAADISYGVPPGHHGTDRSWHHWLHNWLTASTASPPPP